MKDAIGLSAIVLVTERYDDVRETYFDYKNGLDATGILYEIIYVLDGSYPLVLNELKQLRQQGEKLSIVSLAKAFGQATAINAGFEHSSCEIVLLLPAFRQVSGTEIPRMVEALGSSDFAIACRSREKDAWLNRLRATVFSAVVNWISGLELHDAGCHVRAFRRKVLQDTVIYGDLDRFFPVMAYRQGFKVQEVLVSQARVDTAARVYHPGLYLRRFLDIITVFFLFKFTKKPLRFFGLIGSAIIVIGSAVTLYLVGERVFLGVGLGNRPALLLSSLLIVLGIQVFAIGLIGEIVVFSHAKDIKDYSIDEIIN